jgi:hypothetical protein
MATSKNTCRLFRFVFVLEFSDFSPLISNDAKCNVVVLDEMDQTKFLTDVSQLIELTHKTKLGRQQISKKNRNSSFFSSYWIGKR